MDCVLPSLYLTRRKTHYNISEDVSSQGIQPYKKRMAEHVDDSVWNPAPHFFFFLLGGQAHLAELSSKQKEVMFGQT